MNGYIYFPTRSGRLNYNLLSISHISIFNKLPKVLVPGIVCKYVVYLANPVLGKFKNRTNSGRAGDWGLGIGDWGLGTGQTH